MVKMFGLYRDEFRGWRGGGVRDWVPYPNIEMSLVKDLDVYSMFNNSPRLEVLLLHLSTTTATEIFYRRKRSEFNAGLEDPRL